MPKKEALQIPLGFPAPHFELLDTLTGNPATLDMIKGEKATVVMFICNHCPFVQHVIEKLVTLANDYLPRGVAWVAISASDVAVFPADGPAEMKARGESLHFPFPYLYDEDQAVAKAYHAVCTPDFSVFDGDLRCVYRGQLDGARPGNDIPVTGEDLCAALDAVLAGEEVSADQTPSIGCGIEWKEDHEA